MKIASILKNNTLVEIDMDDLEYILESYLYERLNKDNKSDGRYEIEKGDLYFVGPQMGVDDMGEDEYQEVWSKIRKAHRDELKTKESVEFLIKSSKKNFK